MKPCFGTDAVTAPVCRESCPAFNFCLGQWTRDQLYCHQCGYIMAPGANLPIRPCPRCGGERWTNQRPECCTLGCNGECRGPVEKWEWSEPGLEGWNCLWLCEAAFRALKLGAPHCIFRLVKDRNRATGPSGPVGAQGCVSFTGPTRVPRKLDLYWLYCESAPYEDVVTSTRVRLDGPGNPEVPMVYSARMRLKRERHGGLVVVQERELEAPASPDAFGGVVARHHDTHLPVRCKLCGGWVRKKTAQ